MRGLIPAHIMSKIEDATGLRMAEMVDIFCGPSTGAILNAALTLRHPDEPAQPKFRARHMVRFYEREGERIFPPDSSREFRGLIHDFNNRTMKLNQLNWLFRHGHYDPAHLGAALKALYGDAKLRDSLASLVIPTYNIDGDQIEVVEEKGETGESPVHTKNNFIDEGGHAVWLKHIKGEFSKTPDVTLYDSVMASTAAPTYFPCHHFRMRYAGDPRDTPCSGIDGCIFDNPCISYMSVLRGAVPEGHKLHMIVLGTGYTNKSIRREDWNRYGSLGVVDPVNDFPLINILFNASESALLDSFVSEMGSNLHVFNRPLFDVKNNDGEDVAPSPRIDDASPENLNRLRQFTEVILEERQKEFDAVCHLLVSNRDRKSRLAQQRSRKSRRRRYFTFFGGRDETERRDS